MHTLLYYFDFLDVSDKSNVGKTGEKGEKNVSVRSSMWVIWRGNEHKELNGQLMFMSAKKASIQMRQERE